MALMHDSTTLMFTNLGGVGWLDGGDVFSPGFYLEDHPTHGNPRDPITLSLDDCGGDFRQKKGKFFEHRGSTAKGPAPRP